jgi:hypothetical protein
MIDSLIVWWLWLQGILVLFLFVIFAILGVQLWNGLFHQVCSEAGVRVAVCSFVRCHARLPLALLGRVLGAIRWCPSGRFAG